MFYGSPVCYSHNVDRLPVDLLATPMTPPPPDPGDGAITHAEEFFDRDLLMLIFGMVCPNDMREAIDASDRPCTQSLVI